MFLRACTRANAPADLRSMYTCHADTAILGTADVNLFVNGTANATGYTKEQCQQLCDARAACRSYVHVESQTNCALWTLGEFQWPRGPAEVTGPKTRGDAGKTRYFFGEGGSSCHRLG